jgi:hypothetical protein
MFIMIESREEIRLAQSRLEATMRRALQQTLTRNIGYPGGTVRDAEVITDGSYWYRSADNRRVRNPRRLNWFGLVAGEGPLQITVEINTPYEGRNDMTAGFFARYGDNGRVYLMHSGRIGGGHQGVGQRAFFAQMNMRPDQVIDAAGRTRWAVPVVAVDDAAGPSPARRYVDVVAEFKRRVRSNEFTNSEARTRQARFNDYYQESWGRRLGRRATEIDYVSRHGEVVDALAQWRARRGLGDNERLVKDQLIDLGVETEAGLSEVYEVKTSTDRPTYAGIGQLLVHGTLDRCQRTLVLPIPFQLRPDLALALERLGIGWLGFRLAGRRVAITGSS